MNASRQHWAVVTGASSGIGRATALHLAARHWNVVLHCRTGIEAASAVADQIRAAGCEALVVAADFAEPDAGPELAERIWQDVGRVHAWVHNAGADMLSGDNAQLSFQGKLELLTRVDLWGTILTCRAVGARMKAAGSGVLVTMGWDHATTGMEGDSGELFAAAKGGVMAFTKSLAKSLAPVVRVNAVAPGWIRTGWGEQASETWQERALREALLQRWGRPEDVANVIGFLVSDEAEFLTGQIIPVNGGMTGG